MNTDIFSPPHPDTNPTIYAYEDTTPQIAGLFKEGYTTMDVECRVVEQYPIVRPGKPPTKNGHREEGVIYG